MEYKEEDYLQLSGIEHFLFCRRQWALIHIEKQWAENELTTDGDIFHKRVHDRDQTEMRGDILTIRGMSIKISDKIRGNVLLRKEQYHRISDDEEQSMKSCI